MPVLRYRRNGKSEAILSPVHDGTTLFLVFAAFALAVPHVAPGQTSNLTQYYTVLEGDSIFSVAAKVDRGVCDIARANRISDGRGIGTSSLDFL